MKRVKKIHTGIYYLSEKENENSFAYYICVDGSATLLKRGNKLWESKFDFKNYSNLYLYNSFKLNEKESLQLKAQSL